MRIEPAPMGRAARAVRRSPWAVSWCGLIVIGALWMLSACSIAADAPRPDGVAGFDGTRFFNPGQTRTSSVTGYLWLRLTAPRGAWPEEVPVQPASALHEADCVASTRVTMVGHATLLVQGGGLDILTDPIWSARASPLAFAGPKRVAAPGVPFERLPRIEVVLISHDHYDHLDLPTLARLDARDRPRVIVPTGLGDRVARAMPASRVTQHGWGERIDLPGGARIHVEPMVHGSGRTPFDQNRSLWAAYVVEAAGFRTLFVGDSGFGDGSVWRDLAARHGAFDLAFLPIGAYAPESFMADSHMSPASAVDAATLVRARHVVPHHFDTFRLGFEPHGEAPARFRVAAAAAGWDAGRYTLLAPGQAVDLPEAPARALEPGADHRCAEVPRPGRG